MSCLERAWLTYCGGGGGNATSLNFQKQLEEREIHNRIEETLSVALAKSQVSLSRLWNECGF